MIRPTVANVLPILALAACDPCATTFSCAQAPRVAIVGQVRDKTSGNPVRGVRMEMTRERGVGLLKSEIVAFTDKNGEFTLESEASEAGQAEVTLSVAAPGKRDYQILGTVARASLATGDAKVLPPIVTEDPVVPWLLELVEEGTTDTRIKGTPVEFRRTAGVRLFSGDVEVNGVTGVTDGVGWWYPFIGLRANAAGPLVGELIVRHTPTDSVVFTDVTFTAVAWFAPSNGLYRLGVPTP